jgi:methionyl-tRNA formyltransferase
MVIHSQGLAQRPWQRRWRKLRKTMRIGPLGAINGLRMREWYDLSKSVALEPLDEQAKKLNLRFEATPSLFSARTVELFQEANADLGLSLGNGYIPQRVFSVPRLGMINVHHEQLPQFQGAQSILWQIYHGSRTTGFTIHKIDDRIDTGEILYQREMAIEFRDDLAETVRVNYLRLCEASRDALIDVIENSDRYCQSAKPQGPGRTFTTPSYWQYRRMVRRHRELRSGGTP